MKSERRSFPARNFDHRPESKNRGPVQSKCLACGQIVDAEMEQPLESIETMSALPRAPERVGSEVAGKQPANILDLESLLNFSQQLYAHALTLQEVIRNDQEETYEVLRPRYDRQAAQQFEIFYHIFKRTAGLRERNVGSRERMA